LFEVPHPQPTRILRHDVTTSFGNSGSSAIGLKCNRNIPSNPELRLYGTNLFRVLILELEKIGASKFVHETLAMG
jgi:hypothetical protein